MEKRGRKSASPETKLSRIKVSRARYELGRSARSSIKVETDLFRRWCRLRDERGDTNDEFLSHLLAIYEKEARTSDSKPASTTRALKVHLESTDIINGIEKTSMEVIQKETSDEPQPSEEEGYQTFMIKEEIMDEDFTENNTAAQLPVEPPLQRKLESGVCFDSLNRGEDLGAGWRKDSDHQEKLEEVEPSEGVSVQHAETAYKEHFKDGCDEDEGGKNRTSPPSDETHADYQTVECYIKEEPMDAQNACPESSCIESPVQISADGIHHSDDRSPSQAELGIQSDSSRGESSTSGSASKENIDGSMRSVQEMSGDRLSGMKHLKDFCAKGDLGTRSDSSERDRYLCESLFSHAANCSVGLGEESIVDMETRDSASSHLVHGGMDTKNNRNKEEESEEECLMTSVPDVVPSYQPHLPIEDSSSTPMPAPKHPKQYQYSICSKGYSHEVNLSRHIEAHTEEGIFQCAICGKQFSQKSILAEHMRIHREENLHHCNHCGKVFPNLGNLNRHRISHVGEKPHKCRICKKEFNSSKGLLVHMKTHPRTRSYQCSLCSKELSRNSSLTRHITSHTRHRHFKCSLCGKIFTSSLCSKRHMAIHTGEKAFLCSFCGKRFASDYNLSDHMKTHTRQESYLGDLMKSRKGKMQFLSSALKPSHGVQFHTGDEFFQENFADYMKSDKGNQSSASDSPGPAKSNMYKKRYPCSVCDKEFFKSSLLKRHMTTHTGEKSFQCSLCGKGFSLMDHLKRHITIHTGEKAYMC